MHAARLRVELSQSRREQQEYLKNVELAHVLDKRAERKRKAGQDVPALTERPKNSKRDVDNDSDEESRQKKPRRVGKDVHEADATSRNIQLDSVLGSIF